MTRQKRWRREREDSIRRDIQEAREVREELVAQRVSLVRAVTSFRGNRADSFGSDLEDTFNRKPRHA